jgi:putative transposase
LLGDAAVAAHVFHEIYLHFNWHTHNDQPVLTAQLERDVYAFVRERCARTEGVYFLGIGGTETHVHLIVKIEPSLCPSTFVGDLKGACAHAANEAATRQVLRWQRGFGVVSFAKTHLKSMLGYVEDQKKHHAQGKLKPILERDAF